MQLSKTGHNSGCSGSCSLTLEGCSPALSNVLHGAFHSKEKKRSAMQLRNKIQINQNYNVRQLVPKFYKPYLPAKVFRGSTKLKVPPKASEY